MFLDIDKRAHGGLAAVDSDGNKLTYLNLIEFSDFLKEKVERRSIVFFLCNNNVGGIAWYIAMLNSGIVPLLLSSSMDRELFDLLFNEYEPQYVCLPNDKVCSYSYKEVCNAYGYSILKTEKKSYPIYSDLSLLLPTSGSTGSPKLVRHSYANITASAVNISSLFELTGNEKPMLDLPMFYTYGLSIVNSHIYAGATVLITNLGLMQKEYWDFFKEYQASTFTGVPYSYEILKRIRFTRMNFPHLEVLSQGGGKLSVEINREFAEWACNSGKKYIATYGQTEGTARMAYLKPEFAVSKCGSIGKVVPNGKLYLKDTDGNIIQSPGVQGELFYEGNNVTLGYARCKSDLALGDERNGVLNTGDIAEFDTEGFFYIVGRKSRFLKLFGYRIGLDECEQLVRSKFSVECACSGDDNGLVVYTTSNQFGREITDYLSQKTGVIPKAIQVKVIATIPKNEAGKILYGKLNSFENE